MESINIGWKRPQEGWIKLNSDGACKDRGKIVGCGDFFVTQSVDGLKATLRRLVHVMPYMLRRGGCIWVWTSL